MIIKPMDRFVRLSIRRSACIQVSCIEMMINGGKGTHVDSASRPT